MENWSNPSENAYHIANIQILIAIIIVFLYYIPNVPVVLNICALIAFFFEVWSYFLLLPIENEMLFLSLT